MSALESAKLKRDEIELLFGPPTSIISDCLRGFIVPRKGFDFIGADFSSIEARITAWFANETKLLQLFKKNEDVYKAAACDIYNCELSAVDSVRRQVGKVAILALGFGGGKGAFQQMAKSYGVKVKDDEAEKIKEAWRKKNQRIVKLWHELEQAAMHAVKSGKAVSAARGKIIYKLNGSFLTCRLPSGRQICYPYPKIELKDTPWGDKKPSLTAKWVNGTTKKWERRTLWYGVLVENCVQATARDCLVHSMKSLESNNYEIVMHVHDEVLVELEEMLSDESQVKWIMEEMPEWAKGLPVSVETWRGNRYQK